MYVHVIYTDVPECTCIYRDIPCIDRSDICTYWFLVNHNRVSWKKCKTGCLQWTVFCRGPSRWGWGQSLSRWCCSARAEPAQSWYKQAKQGWSGLIESEVWLWSKYTPACTLYTHCLLVYKQAYTMSMHSIYVYILVYTMSDSLYWFFKNVHACLGIYHVHTWYICICTILQNHVHVVRIPDVCIIFALSLLRFFALRDCSELAKILHKPVTWT